MTRKRSLAPRDGAARKSAFRLPPSAFAKPSAFTLVELLVVVSIVAVLAGLLLGVAGVAAETGREARTKQMISRLHTLVMEHYDTYREKRVSLRDDYEQQLTNAGVNLSNLNSGQRRAIGRLAGVRERMKMEMPDRWSDFVLTSFGSDDDNFVSPLPRLQGAGAPDYLNNIPPLAQVYRTAYDRIAAGGVDARTLTNNQGAECLYMIVMYAAGDGESRALFKETDFGDTDGDGALEILDGWGRPIQFLRWAPGYQSDLQLSTARLRQIVSDAEDDPNDNRDEETVIQQAIDADHDPLDLFRVDQPLDANNPFVDDGNQQVIGWRGYRLVPVIYSGGRDESLGLRADSWFTNVLSDPYIAGVDSGAGPESQLGDPLSGAEDTDNITNHLIKSE